jgi:single-strand DNA-binding protein
MFNIRVVSGGRRNFVSSFNNKIIKNSDNMNSLKNNVRLLGNLGMDPDVKNLENNRKVAKFSLATSESYKNDKGDRVTDTQWHNLVLWGVQAKMAEDYLRKGDEVVIEGRLTNRNYIDKEGNKKYFCEVVVNEFFKLSKKN